MLPAPSLVHRTPGPTIAAAVFGVVSATVAARRSASALSTAGPRP